MRHHGGSGEPEAARRVEGWLGSSGATPMRSCDHVKARERPREAPRACSPRRKARGPVFIGGDAMV